MKKLNRPYRCYIPILALFIVSLFFTSCAALNEAQQRRQEKIKRQQDRRHLTLERPDAQINVSPDGLEIGSDHYTLTFHEDLLKSKDFDEPKERQDLGQGALVYMESLYKFIRELFGIEPPTGRIGIILYERYQGTTQLATTEYRYRRAVQGNALLRTVDTIKMNFPMAMFNKNGVRAHELTHAFTTIYYLPTWFTEGIAVFVQKEYAKDRQFKKLDLQDNLKIDTDKVNMLQTWKGHRSANVQWGYEYSYSIAKELYDRFGDDFYPELFRLIAEDKLHQKLPGQMRTSMLVYYMSQSAGQDLVPFFQDLQFNVHRLTRNEITSIIRQATPTQ